MVETPVFSKAAVAAPHHLAAETGKALLGEGANAIEAMIGMAATIAVVYPHMNAIGGDGFWLIREPSGKVLYIEACGPAGSGATIERYRELGYDAIPARGPLAAVTVPGTIGGWQMAQEIAQAVGGKLPRTDLMHDAISLARDGYKQSKTEGVARPFEFAVLCEAPGFAETYLVDGKIPPAGTLRHNLKLADTLDHLALSGFEDFYRGDIGRELATDMEKLGIGITRSDLETYHAMRREPLQLKLPGRTHYNAPPPTQGLASLMILGIFDRLGIKEAESFAHIHALVEASKRALAIRDRVCTDFDALTVDPDAYLCLDAFEREVSKIDMKRAASLPLPPGAGDTIWMGAIDASGRAVSFIQSIYWEYGSGCVLPRTGVDLQNRGISFSLDPKAINPLTPGRRPFHTLNPALTVFDDGRVLSYGSMGGDGQPQFQAQVMTRILFGEGLAGAVEAPRFLFGKTWGNATTTLKLEPRFDSRLFEQLEKAGHEIEILSEPYASDVGHAGALMHFPNKRVEATHDPRSDGGAAGV
jgi:gamma-glutamyltranspeptidase/glutathione hydrolase